MQHQYAAPERFLRKNVEEKIVVTIGEKSEVWSIAAILLELMTGFTPVGPMNAVMTHIAYHRGERRDLSIDSDRYCDKLVELIDGMLQLDPEKRTGLSEAVEALAVIEADALFHLTPGLGLIRGSDDDDQSSGGSGLHTQKREHDDGEQTSSGSGGDHAGKRRRYDRTACSEAVERLPETDAGSSGETTATAGTTAGDAGAACSGRSSQIWGMGDYDGDVIVLQDGPVIDIPAGRGLNVVIQPEGQAQVPAYVGAKKVPSIIRRAVAGRWAMKAVKDEKDPKTGLDAAAASPGKAAGESVDSGRKSQDGDKTKVEKKKDWI